MIMKTIIIEVTAVSGSVEALRKLARFVAPVMEDDPSCIGLTTLKYGGESADPACRIELVARLGSGKFDRMHVERVAEYLRSLKKDWDGKSHRMTIPPAIGYVHKEQVFNEATGLYEAMEETP